MATSPFIGYPSQIWSTCWQAMDWLSGVLSSGAANISVIDDPVTATIGTLRNALNALAAWQTGNALALELQVLQPILTMPLGLDPATSAYVAARIAAVSSAATQIAALVPAASPFNAIAALQNGSAAVADPLFLEWCMAFVGEPSPAGLTNANILTSAAAAAQAWLTTANAIGALQGTNTTPVYDAAARMYRCSGVASANLGQLQSGGFSENNTTALWNGTVALPTILLNASTLACNPASLLSQQVQVIRYALNVQWISLSLLSISLRSHNIIQPQTAFLSNTESLMDLANRVNGDFETWTEIATINNLRPPFPGPSNQTVAQEGQPLFTSAVGVIPDPDAIRPTYAENVLGTDYDFGPINGVQPPWLGDIAVITGLLNYARAVGRRLQTSLGTLVYHPDYGSRIPPEVGAIQSADEASRLAAYGNAAVTQDPRTGTVLSYSATAQPGFLATFQATLLPIGPGQTPTLINETIGAPP